MCSAHRITADITMRVKFSASDRFDAWRIGITQDAAGTTAKWERLPSFNCIATESLREACDVESFFVNEEKMQSLPAADELVEGKQTHVYFFIAAEAG